MLNRRQFAAGALGFAAAAPASTPCWIAARPDGAEQLSYADADRAVSMGSLLKPFLAAAYLRAGREAPVVECRGAQQGCWKPGGHGRLHLPEAIAYSCNVYFLHLANAIDRAALEMVCMDVGLHPPGREWNAGRLIGLQEGWPQTPRAVVRAYVRLVGNSADASVRPVLRGMALCARYGTANACGLACYAKTGTAPCSHPRGGAGDGYALALYPLEQPRSALLVMMHDAPGAQAARSLRPIATGLA